MTIIGMAINDTIGNKRSPMTEECINSLLPQVDAERHSLYLIDNGSCQDTKNYLKSIEHKRNVKKIITLPENIGTARAINIAWSHRVKNEPCVKMDNDVIIEDSYWLEQMEEAINMEPKIGIIGLKRRDCWENPYHENPGLKSELLMINPPGERWVIVERVLHVIGTCQMYSSAFLDKMGYLYQIGLYGYDDVIASHKSMHAGFINCFLPHIGIDHIDPGDTPYQDWKEKASGEVREQVEAYLNTLNATNIYQALY
jgi:hypothetical protein